jgi:drug/metabolite transporter (DMT)-like permease
MTTPCAYARRDHVVAAGGLLLSTLIFSGFFIAAGHGTRAGLSSLDLVTLRYAVPGLVLLPAVLGRGPTAFAGLGWRRAVVLTLLGGIPYGFSIIAGVTLSTAAHGAVLSSGVTTVAALLLTWLMLGERPRAGAVIGVPLTLAGLVLVVDPGSWSSSGGMWVGDVLLTAGAVSYGLVTVLLQVWRISPVPAAAVMNVLSAAVWLPCYAALTGFRPLLTAPVEELIGQSLYLGVLAGGVAVMLYTHGVRVIGPSLSAQFQVLIPAFGALLAAGLLGERLAVAQWAGIAAVVLGIFAAAFNPRAAFPIAEAATDAR